MFKLNLLLLVVASLQNLQAKTSEPNFHLKKILIKVSDVITIDSAAKWYLNFDRLKNTVVYSNKIISMGLYGGIVCIDPQKMIVDQRFTKKLNSDFYTNITCRLDTLFSEKFGEIYYLNSDTVWTKYDLKYPVKFFDILYEDDHYIFYPCDFGEWGSNLFIYDKYQQCTKGLSVSDCPQSVIKQNDKFIISGATFHGGGSSELYTINDIDKINVLVKGDFVTSMKILLEYWNGIKRLNYSDSKNFIIPLKTVEYGTTNTIFQQDSTIYSIEQNLHSNKFAFITNLNTNETNKMDSVSLKYLQEVHSFNGNTIINLSLLKSSFLFISSDTIYEISFTTNKSYTFAQGFGHETDYSFTLGNDSIKQNQITICDNKTQNGNLEMTMKYDFNNESSIYSASKGWDFSKDDLFIILNGKKHNLKFTSKKNYLRFGFNYHGNDFLYFQNSGNVEHKYGLIEILDINRFIRNYCY